MAIETVDREQRPLYRTTNFRVWRAQRRRRSGNSGADLYVDCGPGAFRMRISPPGGPLPEPATGGLSEVNGNKAGLAGVGKAKLGGDSPTPARSGQAMFDLGGRPLSNLRRTFLPDTVGWSPRCRTQLCLKSFGADLEGPEFFAKTVCDPQPAQIQAPR